MKKGLSHGHDETQKKNASHIPYETQKKNASHQTSETPFHYAIYVGTGKAFFCSVNNLNLLEKE